MVGLDESPGLDGLIYDVYLRQSSLLAHLLALIFNNGIKQGSIPQSLTRGMIKLLRKYKKGGHAIGNFRSLTMLNTELISLAKILARRFQTVLSSLIGSE